MREVTGLSEQNPKSLKWIFGSFSLLLTETNLSLYKPTEDEFSEKM